MFVGADTDSKDGIDGVGLPWRQHRTIAELILHHKYKVRVISSCDKNLKEWQCHFLCLSVFYWQKAEEI